MGHSFHTEMTIRADLLATEKVLSAGGVLGDGEGDLIDGYDRVDVIDGNEAAKKGLTLRGEDKFTVLVDGRILPDLEPG